MVYFTPEVEAALKELLNNNNEAVPAPDQIENSCSEEFRHRQRELRIKHFENLKLYPVMLRVGDKKKHFWRVTKPRFGGGRSVKTYSNRYEVEAAFDLAPAQVANRDIESREKPVVARPLAPPQANDLPIAFRYLISTEVLGNRYSVTPETIKYWTKKRRIPCVKIGRQLLFNIADCDRAADRFKRNVS